METYEIKRFEDSPQEYWKSVSSFSGIGYAVEKAAAYFCAKEVEFVDFECFAREVGAPDWQKFHVVVRSEPVYFAMAVTP